MQTKTEQVRQALAAGHTKEALREAAKFRIVTREQHVAISRAYEMLIRPSFFEALGFHREQTIATGIEQLKTVLR